MAEGDGLLNRCRGFKPLPRVRIPASPPVTAPDSLIVFAARPGLPKYLHNFDRRKAEQRFGGRSLEESGNRRPEHQRPDDSGPDRGKENRPGRDVFGFLGKWMEIR